MNVLGELEEEIAYTSRYCLIFDWRVLGRPRKPSVSILGLSTNIRILHLCQRRCHLNNLLDRDPFEFELTRETI